VGGRGVHGRASRVGHKRARLLCADRKRAARADAPTAYPMALVLHLRSKLAGDALAVIDKRLADGYLTAWFGRRRLLATLASVVRGCSNAQHLIKLAYGVSWPKMNRIFVEILSIAPADY